MLISVIYKVTLFPIFTHLIEYVVNNFNFYKLCILYFQFCRIKVYILSTFLFQFQHSVCAIFIRIFTTLDMDIKIDFTYLWVKESIETNQLFGYIMLIEYKINEFRISFFLLIYLTSDKMCSFFYIKKISHYMGAQIRIQLKKMSHKMKYFLKIYCFKKIKYKKYM